MCQALCLHYLTPPHNPVVTSQLVGTLFFSLSGALSRTTGATCGEALCQSICLERWQLCQL